MKNLVYFNRDCLSIYQNARDSKQKPALISRLTALHADMVVAFEAYRAAFDLNTLESIPLNPLFTPHKLDLEDLYHFQSATIRRLKEDIDLLQPFPLGNTCQNCSINSVNSMDHVLGQARFPEYCVHPLNLFPSCSECNSLKAGSFVKNGARRFLNLYCDQLPQLQYLFLEIYTNVNGDLDWSFLVDNRNNIDNALFALIENHYKELDLLSRMKLHSIKFYNELRATIHSRLQDVPWDVIIRQVTREAAANMNNLGINHFEYVLQMAMINHPLFRQSFA